MKRSCLFCAVPLVNRSREHVFPKWLLKELDIADAKVSPTHFRAGTMDVVSTRSHTLKELNEGRVCATCNNGWMSDLESAAKPLLIALFHGEQDVRDLDFRERRLLARWAAKTAYMLNSASNYCMKVPPAHLHYIRTHEHRLPERVMAVGQQHRNTSKFHWGQVPIWSVRTLVDENPDTNVEVIARDGYKICLQFAQLMLLVCYLPVPGWRYVLWREIHHPLWPLMGPLGWEEREEDFPWNDSVDAISKFAGAVEVMSGGYAEKLSEGCLASEPETEAGRGTVVAECTTSGTDV